MPEPVLNVLLATDGSDASLRAAHFVARTLDPARARVQVHTVLSASLDPTGYFGDLSDADERRATIEAAAEEATRPCRDLLEAAGFPTTRSTSLGHPPDQVLAAAQHGPADLVVVGSRGLRAPAAMILGSVSTHLIHHATMPVLVVP